MKQVHCIGNEGVVTPIALKQSPPTLLFCAGGQSSSLTPNVTPGDGFFSNGFLISPGMPFLHVPLSLGGLVSSGWSENIL